MEKGIFTMRNALLGLSLIVLSAMMTLGAIGCGSSDSSNNVANNGDTEATENTSTSDGDQTVINPDADETAAEGETSTETGGRCFNANNVPINPPVAFCDWLAADFTKLERVCYQPQPDVECTRTEIGLTGWQCAGNSAYIICYDTDGNPVDLYWCELGGVTVPATDSVGGRGYPGCDFTKISADGDTGEADVENADTETGSETETSGDNDTNETDTSADGDATDTDTSVDGDTESDGDTDVTPLNCDDGNPCTIDLDGGNRCIYGWQPEGAPCDDGNACTQMDTCEIGVCRGGNPVVCAASDQCHEMGLCDPNTGVCDNPWKPNGSICNDSNACTLTDSCQSGACVGGDVKTCPAEGQ